jgi:two-component system phosphate regulon sensor histidine kinase PhoR
LLNDYSRFWHGAPDMPLAAETFGAVMCVPLIHRDQVEGVLLVVAERDGRLFDKEDMQLLQLLGPQAAVAISNSQLFEQERALTAQVISARNQLKTVLDSTENPVIAVDRKLNIVFANPALVHLLPALSEHSSETLASRCLLDYVQRDMLPKNLRQFVRTIQETHSFVYEVNIGENDYWCHVAPLTEPNRGWVAVLNDITELKRVDRLKSLIVHMTSHDLKNPLTGIVIHLDLLENAGQKVFNDKMNRYMDTIREQVNRMQRIISGILDLNRLETGAPPLEAFEISEVLERAVEDMESQAQLKGLKLHSEIDDINAAVVGDAQQIGQAIINLIENAIKFTPTGGDSWVQAELDNKSIKICVRDTGIGIPKAVQNRVFDRFFRVNPSATNGSGLGLSLVKAVVDRHKGTIWLHSEENVGSSFYIALPLATKKKPTPLPALIAE